jgi:hypothetical protein
MAHLTESEIESATLSWLSGLSYQTLFGPDIAPGEPAGFKRTRHRFLRFSHTTP